MDSFWVGKTFVRQAELEDAEIIGKNMREIDKFESATVLGLGPVDAVKMSIAHSLKAWTGEVGGVPYSCGGFSEYAPSVACIWQLGTDDVAKNVRDFLRIGKKIVGKYCDDYEVVFNLISEENRASMNYVKMLGFQLTDRSVMFARHNFIYFERRRLHVR